MRLTLAILLIASPAAARPDLTVRRPPPRLTMRVVTPPASPPRFQTSPTSTSTSTSTSTPTPTSTSLAERVIFRFDLGYGIDGGRPSGAPLASGAALDETTGYDRLRRYALGDLALGSRGLLVTPLATYLAASYRFDQPLGQATGAIPSTHDHPAVADVMVRAGWAEVDGLLGGRLRPLYLRAGRQYRYGVAVAQFDGVSLGYDAAAGSASGFIGQRVFAWSAPVDPAAADALAGVALDDATMAGFELRLDLAELRRVPVVATLNGLAFDGTRHLDGGLALRLRPDVLLHAGLRTRDGEAARAALSLWARLSAVTTINVDLERRAAGDWMYDLIAADRGHAAGDLRRYLDLGPPVPRTTLDLRAGTALLSNLDVVVRAGGGLDQRVAPGDDAAAVDAPTSAYTRGYLEAGGAVEVRLRRNLRLGTSLAARRYRGETVAPAMDGAGADSLPATAAGLGERASYEGGTRIQYSGGARRFDAWVELYGRAYVLETPWTPVGEDETDLRSGGRFGVEAWAGRRLRVRGEYDVSLGELRAAPELLGVKSLRVLAEGTY